MMKIISSNSKELNDIADRYTIRRRRVENVVRKVLDDVRATGDEAILRYTRKFDKVKINNRQIKVSEREIVGAFQSMDPKLVDTLKIVMDNVRSFYKKQIRKSWKKVNPDGVILGEKIEPLKRVGVYVPSGSVPLVSSVYMTVLPALMAGVKEIVLVSPPNQYGTIDSHILAVANLLKVNEIYKVGGAQAIAGLAFGTKTIPKVDKIVGPGNQYVTEAKRQVFGYVDIDMIAGPSEVVIVANRFANLDYVIADLRAQAEHYKGSAILVTFSKKVAKEVAKEVDSGYVVVVKSLNEAAEVVNRIAPEHLEIMVKRSNKLIKNIKNAGAIFVGPYSPTAVGDYVAGPSHVLPTGGTARFFSGLGVDDFLKSTHIISYSKKALENVHTHIERIAALEGLKKHLASVEARFK